MLVERPLLPGTVTRAGAEGINPGLAHLVLVPARPVDDQIALPPAGHRGGASDTG
jgi:hypothetical protein